MHIQLCVCVCVRVCVCVCVCVPGGEATTRVRTGASCPGHVKKAFGFVCGFGSIDTWIQFSLVLIVIT